MTPAERIADRDDLAEMVERKEARIRELEALSDEMLTTLKRIDSINDHPGRFNSEINDLTQAAIRKAEPQQ